MAWLPVGASATRSARSRTATASSWCRSELATSTPARHVRGSWTLGGGGVMTTAPQDALAVTTAFAPRPDYRTLLGALAVLEGIRLAKHPALLVGTALGVVFTAMALNEEADQVSGDLSLPVVALTVGLGAMLSAYYLTRSFQRAEELLDAAPTSRITRTG